MNLFIFVFIERVNYEDIHICFDYMERAIEFYSQENIEILLIRISVDM